MKQLERIHRKLAATPQLSSVLTICGLLLVVFASMCVYSESYRSAYNVTNVLVQCVPLACVSLGQTLVIISGGIDLSVGSTISVCTAIAARLMGSDNPAQVLLGVVVVFAFAAGVGLVNGAGVNYLKVPPMITTLCTSTILEGVALWILPVAGGQNQRRFRPGDLQEVGHHQYAAAHSGGAISGDALPALSHPDGHQPVCYRPQQNHCRLYGHQDHPGQHEGIRAGRPCVPR